jgi:hypothetical protein
MNAIGKRDRDGAACEHEIRFGIKSKCICDQNEGGHHDQPRIERGESLHKKEVMSAYSVGDGSYPVSELCHGGEK